MTLEDFMRLAAQIEGERAALHQKKMDAWVQYAEANRKYPDGYKFHSRSQNRSLVITGIYPQPMLAGIMYLCQDLDEPYHTGVLRSETGITEHTTPIP